MVSVLALVGLVVLLAGHTLIAAILSRLFRVRLSTTWGALLYTVTVVPFVLLASTMVLSGVFAIGPNLGGRTAAFVLVIGVPLALGVTIDYVWMPRPEEVELPETT